LTGVSRRTLGVVVKPNHGSYCGYPHAEAPMEPLRFPVDKISIRGKAFRIIKEKAWFEGDFVLASGKRSKYYLDMKPAMFSPEGSNVLARLVFEKIRDLPVDYVGGLEMGAVPLIGPINMISYDSSRPIPGFFVRKQVKDHGTMKLIEAVDEDDLKGKNVVILDDVTTSGCSAMIAVDAVKTKGAKVLLVLSIVDREEGATEFFAGKDIPFERLFKTSDFINS
jgi:orotate phosphoribosyltransferase